MWKAISHLASAGKLQIMKSLILNILVIMPGVWSGHWSVTSENQCALKGTSVLIKCKYNYPSGHIVTSVTWSKLTGRLTPLHRLPSPPGHFNYLENIRGDCSLKVNYVQHADEGDYYFSFVTRLERWTSRKPTKLYVRELTTVVQPSTVTEGDHVRLTCKSGCPEPSYIVWFRDGQPVSNPVFQARREDAGRYYCAVHGQETVRSAPVALNVQYRPMNISVSMDPQHFAEGGNINLTCSSVANPAADNYTWYKMVGSDSSSSMLQVGSGQVLSLPSVEESHSGVYLCQVRNTLGESNSTNVWLSMQGKQNGGQSVPVLAGIGVSLFVTLVVALLLFWKKQKTSATKKTAFDPRFTRTGSRSSATEDTIYANIHTFHSLTPSEPLQAITAASQRSSHHDDVTSYEDEVTYSTVTIRPKDPSLPHHLNSSRGPQDSWYKAREEDDCVIYATVVKSS